MDSQNKIKELEYRINILSKSVKQFETEINQLRQEMDALQAIHAKIPERLTKDSKINQEKSVEPAHNQAVSIIHDNNLYTEEATSQKLLHSLPVSSATTDEAINNTQPHVQPQKNLEEFIGGNIVNKLGILILVLGVGIFLKYAIESNLIGNLGRITLGYITGMLLIGIAYRLKKQYTAYSAVLLSGGVATLYFTTYVAYDFYNFMPQWSAFLLMVFITVFTVYAAIAFDQQVVGVLGLAGAYAVPILLSNGSGKVEVLFAYMAIINTGIAILASRKKWPKMNTTAFALTWLIFSGWFVLSYEVQYVLVACLFSCIFFITFHTVFLLYQLTSTGLQKNNTLWILLNSFIYYGIGYAIFYNYNQGSWLSVFTLANAFIHGIAAVYVYSITRKLSSLFYLLIGLSLSFVTLTIPIALDGSWITLLWSVEAIMLFWIGRNKNITFIEQLSYVLMLLSISSLIYDWNFYRHIQTSPSVTFLLNMHFATSCWVVLTCLAVLLADKQYPGSKKENVFLTNVLPFLTIVITYFAFFQEITFYFDTRSVMEASALNMQASTRMVLLKWVWLINYSALFITLLAVIGLRYIATAAWYKIVWLLNALVIIIWCVYGLPKLNTLRDQYFFTDLQSIPAYTIWIRYISYFCMGLSVLATQRLVNRNVLPRKSFFTKVYPILSHTFVLVLLSAELVQFTWYLSDEQAANNQIVAQKLGFSVLWGVYSFFLIASGIWRKKKILRLMGISLFAITLLKLFLLDLNNISTLNKIIAFIGLGVLLLVISFLYQKFKMVILAEDAS